MVNKESIDWVKEQESHGFTPQQIYGFLIDKGYSQQEATEAIEGIITAQNKSTEQSPKKSNKGIIILAIFLFLSIAGGAAYIYFFQNELLNTVLHRDFSSTIELTDDKGNNFGEANINISADMTVVSDCGAMDCFNERFKSCQPAKITYALMDNLVYYYEIISVKDGFCEVKSRFDANPNPDWVNKEMVCSYDNSIEFETAIRNMSNCYGELYVLMTGD